MTAGEFGALVSYFVPFGVIFGASVVSLMVFIGQIFRAFKNVTNG